MQKQAQYKYYFFYCFNRNIRNQKQIYVSDTRVQCEHLEKKKK